MNNCMKRGSVSSELIRKLIRLDVDGEHIYYGTYDSMLALSDQLSTIGCKCSLFVWSIVEQRWVAIR